MATVGGIVGGRGRHRRRDRLRRVRRAVQRRRCVGVPRRPRAGLRLSQRQDRDAQAHLDARAGGGRVARAAGQRGRRLCGGCRPHLQRRIECHRRHGRPAPGRWRHRGYAVLGQCRLRARRGDAGTGSATVFLAGTPPRWRCSQSAGYQRQRGRHGDQRVAARGGIQAHPHADAQAHPHADAQAHPHPHADAQAHHPRRRPSPPPRRRPSPPPRRRPSPPPRRRPSPPPRRRPSQHRRRHRHPPPPLCRPPPRHRYRRSRPHRPRPPPLAFPSPSSRHGRWPLGPRPW